MQASAAALRMPRNAAVGAPLSGRQHCHSCWPCTRMDPARPAPQANACCQKSGRSSTLLCSDPIPCLILSRCMQALLDAGVNLTRRTCVSDEHYIPSLLAAHGLDAQTDCTGVLTHSDWAWPNWSPKLYSHLDVDRDLVHRRVPAPAAACLGLQPVLSRRRVIAGGLMHLSRPISQLADQGAWMPASYLHGMHEAAQPGRVLPGVPSAPSAAMGKPHSNAVHATQPTCARSLRSHRWFSAPPGQCDYRAMLASASRLFGRRGGWDPQHHVRSQPFYSSVVAGCHTTASVTCIMSAVNCCSDLAARADRGAVTCCTLPGEWLMNRLMMTPHAGWQDTWANFVPLPHACSLFARKFDTAALDAVIRQGQDCEAGFGWSPICVNV